MLRQTARYPRPGRLPAQHRRPGRPVPEAPASRAGRPVPPTGRPVPPAPGSRRGPVRCRVARPAGPAPVRDPGARPQPAVGSSERPSASASLALRAVFDLGTVTAMIVVTVVVTLAAAEAYAAFRKGGYHPATLLGLVATVSLMVATYNKGQEALPLVSGAAGRLYLAVAPGRRRAGGRAGRAALPPPCSSSAGSGSSAPSPPCCSNPRSSPTATASPSCSAR